MLPRCEKIPQELHQAGDTGRSLDQDARRLVHHKTFPAFEQDIGYASGKLKPNIVHSGVRKWSGMRNRLALTYTPLSLCVSNRFTFFRNMFIRNIPERRGAMDRQSCQFGSLVLQYALPVHNWMATIVHKYRFEKDLRSRLAIFELPAYTLLGHCNVSFGRAGPSVKSVKLLL